MPTPADLAAARIMLAADTLGAASHMLTAAVAYAQQREQFGKKMKNAHTPEDQRRVIEEVWASTIHTHPWMADVLAARDRNAAAPTFAPDGLYFAGPYYDPHLNLPENTPAMDWLP